MAKSKGKGKGFSLGLGGGGGGGLGLPGGAKGGLAGQLQAMQKHDAALRQVKYDLQYWPSDAQLYFLQAKSYAAEGKALQQYRSQAEGYMLRGQLMPAIQQLMQAQKAPDGDFFEHSQVDARLRELKQRQAEEAKAKP